MVSVTFDDAWKSQYNIGIPILERYGVFGTFYITTQYFDTPEYSGFMTKEEVLDMHRRGHEIGGHTITHPDLASLTQVALERELRDSKTVLENLIGVPVRSVAYPYGSYNASVIEMSKRVGYESGRTVNIGFNTKSTPPYELYSISPTRDTPLSEVLSAIDEAQKNGTWLIIALHELGSTGNQYMHTDAYLEAIVQHIQNVGIRSVTVSEGMAL
jgi:peptidoglycan/xylan/chitin deacetylase (PgdA/CDA1 family)